MAEEGRSQTVQAPGIGQPAHLVRGVAEHEVAAVRKVPGDAVSQGRRRRVIQVAGDDQGRHVGANRRERGGGSVGTCHRSQASR